MEEINLFEYQNKEEFEGNIEKFEEYLQEIWANREKNEYFIKDSKKQEVQQFLTIFHKDQKIKSKKYVGVINFNGCRINLLPKIFYEKDQEINDDFIKGIHYHILWWLSYCRKIKFPSYKHAMEKLDSDFFEVMIYLFSKYTLLLLFKMLYQNYEEKEEELSFVKGRINFNKYINNLSNGRWHKIPCVYDSFDFDNKFNRIIKYVAKLLINATKNQESKKNLREIIFILDEVKDTHAKAEDCLTIRFNPVFSELETVRDYCYIFLKNCISFNFKDELKLFAFLLPMEYVFQDFVFGFIDKEIETIKINHKSKYLDKDGIFTLKPDYVLEIKGKDDKIIADAKYKIIYSDEEKELKKAISQNDLYQVITYAIRYKAKNVYLFYPKTIKQNEQSLSLTIKDNFCKNAKIEIKIYQLPIINEDILKSLPEEKKKLSEIFDETKENLKDKLEKILGVHDEIQSKS